MYEPQKPTRRPNKDIRNYMAHKKVYSEELSKALGMTKKELCRELYRKIPDEKKYQIYNAIDMIADERNGEWQC